jgi:pimeloyl-ACP methyl ester carboxylesterase
VPAPDAVRDSFTLRPLPPAVPGERIALDGAAGPVTLYAAGPPVAGVPPMLLVHSVNAAASAYEIRPVYEHFAARRRVYAPDLPGFGLSDRSDRIYTPRLMTDAIHDALDAIEARHGPVPVDVLGLSLGCEFVARAVVERPERFRSVALASPTSFGRRAPRRGPPGSHLGMPWLHKVFTQPLWSEQFFRALTHPKSVRFFLRKTFGSKVVDQGLWEYDWLTTRQPGARHAPFYFVSGFLFARDANALYESIDKPVWMSHGTVGDFTDYAWKSHMADRPNWRFTVYEGCGALPWFQARERFLADFGDFLGWVERAV